MERNELARLAALRPSWAPSHTDWRGVDFAIEDLFAQDAWESLARLEKGRERSVHAAFAGLSHGSNALDLGTAEAGPLGHPQHGSLTASTAGTSPGIRL